MNETTSDNSPLSILDSSKFSGSTTGRSSNNDALEICKKRLRELEGENLLLMKALPHLKDAKGDDCTDWAVEISNELEQWKEKYRESENKLAAIAHDHRKFREDAERNARQYDQALGELKRKAEGLEEENRRLLDQLRDEESANFHLHQRIDVAGADEHGGDEGERSEAEMLLAHSLQHLDQQSEADEPKSGRSQRSTGGQKDQRPDSSKDTALEGITLALFDKLRSTADFFEQLLSSFGNDIVKSSEKQQVQDLIERIKSLKLDLNRSLETYNRKVEELRRSAVSSVDNSFRCEGRPGPSSCAKCELVECERDSLKAQLNREIALKEEHMRNSEELEKSLREMRRGMGELQEELQMSRAKVAEVEQKLQRKEEFYREKYAGQQPNETAKLNELVRDLRKRNVELDARNEEILKAVHRLKELNQEEMNNKDIELHRQLDALEDEGRRSSRLEEKLTNERKARQELEDELRKRDARLEKYRHKLVNMREILQSYGQYFDASMEYEKLVDKSTEILQSKIHR